MYYTETLLCELLARDQSFLFIKYRKWTDWHVLIQMNCLVINNDMYLEEHNYPIINHLQMIFTLYCIVWWYQRDAFKIIFLNDWVLLYIFLYNWLISWYMSTCHTGRWNCTILHAWAGNNMIWYRHRGRTYLHWFMPFWCISQNKPYLIHQIWDCCYIAWHLKASLQYHHSIDNDGNLYVVSK